MTPTATAQYANSIGAVLLVDWGVCENTPDPLSPLQRKLRQVSNQVFPNETRPQVPSDQPFTPG